MVQCFRLFDCDAVFRPVLIPELCPSDWICREAIAACLPRAVLHLSPLGSTDLLLPGLSTELSLMCNVGLSATPCTYLALLCTCKVKGKRRMGSSSDLCGSITEARSIRSSKIDEPGDGADATGSPDLKSLSASIPRQRGLRMRDLVVLYFVQLWKESALSSF